MLVAHGRGHQGDREASHNEATRVLNPPVESQRSYVTLCKAAETPERNSEKHRREATLAEHSNPNDRFRPFGHPARTSSILIVMPRAEVAGRLQLAAHPRDYLPHRRRTGFTHLEHQVCH